MPDYESHAAVRVHAKWGFGLAPEKPSVRMRREAATRRLLELIETLGAIPNRQDADAISEVKGLYTRAWRQDQWDWFLVWAQLGRLPTHALRDATSILKDLGRALRAGNTGGALQTLEALRRLHLDRGLRAYIEGRPAFEGGSIYILSTREQPQILKIGFTRRDPVTRVAEINAATGVVVPYGVRAAWPVDNPAVTEAAVHALLKPYRIRPDREFFQIEIREAMRLINDLLRNWRAE